MVFIDKADKVFIKIGLFSLIFRYFLAFILPIANDEAYYLDWSRNLQLSYFDHPPGVAVVSFLSRQLFTGQLAARGLSPIIFLLSSWFLWLSYKKISNAVTQKSAFWFSLYLFLIPALSLWGVTLMPDLGLFLSISIVLWLSITWYSRNSLNIWQGVLLGLALGVGGLFKYHILLVGGGISLALFIDRVLIRKIRFDLGFWVAVVVAGAVTTLPVWVWNYQNNFDGILFQSHHGFGDGGFNLLFIARTLLGLLVVVGPSLFIQYFKLWNKKYWETGKKQYFIYFMLGSSTLICILLYSSLFKQSLPHWFYPAFWVSFPFVFHKLLSERRRYFIGNLMLCCLVTVGATLALGAYKPIFEKNMQNSESFLSELTMWDEISENIDYQKGDLFIQSMTVNPDSCPGRSYASFRWYWAAQLNFRDSKHRWTSVDPDNKSYYDYIRPGLKQTGCRMVLLGDARHLDLRKIRDSYNILNAINIDLKRHSYIDLTMYFVEVK